MTRKHISILKTSLREQTSLSKPSKSCRYRLECSRWWRNCDATHITFSTHLPEESERKQNLLRNRQNPSKLFYTNA